MRRERLRVRREVNMLGVEEGDGRLGDMEKGRVRGEEGERRWSVSVRGDEDVRIGVGREGRRVEGVGEVFG